LKGRCPEGIIRCGPTVIDSSPEVNTSQSVAPGTVTPVGRPGLLTTEFISELAHELRAPLTSIKGYVDYLLEGVAGDVSPVQQEFLHRTQANATRLMALLGDLLDLVRLDAGQLVPNLVSVPLDAVLATVTSEACSTASPRAIEVTAEGATNAVVWADREMLQRLLLTLVRRAISRTPDRGRVFTLVELDDADRIVMSIRDTGANATRCNDQIFASFEFLPASATRDERTGLELVIAKALAEVQGGRIWAASEPGRDTAICFSLPAAESEPSA
jgi:signal transduction histidine kinase